MTELKKIIHFDDLSILEGKEPLVKAAELIMSENEVFVFQLAVLSDYDDVINSVNYSGALSISCINTDVVDKYGKRKIQSVSLKKNNIQPLFFTVTADKNGKREERCSITINCKENSYSADFVFHIIASPVENSGYNDINTLARLKWLN